MSAPHRERDDLERDLGRVLREMAPSPKADAVERAMRAVDSTPQRRPLLRQGGRRRWPAWATLAVVAAGALAGVAFSLAATSPTGTGASPSPAGSVEPLASADAGGSSTPIRSASPAASPRPTDDGAEPIGVLGPDAAWEAIDLPDPAPGVDGGAVPSDIVAFGGGYVVVGSVEGFCGSDILIPEPGCDERLAELTDDPRLRSATVWISDDGRSWEMVESSTFERGAMLDAATDGERIIVSGRVFDSPASFGSTAGDPAIWSSTDGRHWELAAAGGALPELVERTPNGWVGVRTIRGEGPGGLIVDHGPQFFASDDGVTWTPVSTPVQLGPGRAEALAVDVGGRVVAVGYHEVITADGLLESSIGLAWRTDDGVSWEAARGQEALAMDGQPGGLYLQAVAAVDDGWMAFGRADDAEGGVGGWRSGDGLTWERLPEDRVPAGGTEGMDSVSVNLLLYADPGLVAAGSSPGSSGSEASIWLSADGSRWDLVRAHELASGGIRALAVDGDLVLAAAARSPSTDNYLPVVLLADR